MGGPPGPVERVAVILLIAVYSLPVFIFFSAPGLAACALVRRHVRHSFWKRASSLSLLCALLLSPELVPGHTPLILPFPFGIWLALHMRNPEAALVGLACAGMTLSIMALVSWRFWIRERIGTEPQGGIERLWRGV